MGHSISKQRCIILKVFIQDSKKTKIYSQWLHDYETSHERDISWLKYLSEKLNKKYFKKFGLQLTSEKEIYKYEKRMHVHV